MGHYYLLYGNNKSSNNRVPMQGAWPVQSRKIHLYVWAGSLESEWNEIIAISKSALDNQINVWASAKREKAEKKNIRSRESFF